MKATADVLTTTKFGMFCILGISKLEQIDLAAEHRLGFIRIGTNVENVADAEPFIAKAGSYGMFISANFMNVYVMKPTKFAEKVKRQRYSALNCFVWKILRAACFSAIRTDTLALCKMCGILGRLRI
jgi:4-hydroxy 2-oxovalerate aldolase/long-chain acyl-CoA synthetase